MRSEFIDPDDVRWARFLECTNHDVYHLPEYAALAARHEGGRPVSFYAETARHVILIPLLLRSLPSALGAPSHWRDASSPYGYACPITTAPGDPEVLDAFLAALRSLALGHDVLSVFLRCNPVLELHHGPFRRHGTMVRRGETVVVDLALPESELRAQMRHGHTGDIRKLERLGYHVVFDDWSLLGEFVRIYHATMDRVDAAAVYRFPPAYFHEFRDALSEQAHLSAVLSPDGEVAAAGLFTESDGIVQFHLSGTAADHIRRAPSKLMIVHAIAWGRSRKDRVLHLGGGVGGADDSLLRFKGGFSHSRSEFHTCGLTIDPTRCRQAELLRRARCTCGTTEAAGFFPAYRRLCECARTVGLHA